MIGFYIFMLIVTLLVPAVMLFFGYCWQVKPPPKINRSYGYRTRRSMSSKKAWDFAHKHCGKSWVKLGWFTLFVSLICMVVLPFYTLEIETVSVFSIAIVILQCILLTVPLVTTERALMREFGI